MRTALCSRAWIMCIARVAANLSHCPQPMCARGSRRTSTSEGKTVPYIVRVETGTINRAIYQTAILSDPSTEHAVSPFAPPSAWNRRLVYTFGGGCIGGWYIQGHTIGNGGILEDLMLRQGYGVASVFSKCLWQQLQ